MNDTKMTDTSNNISTGDESSLKHTADDDSIAESSTNKVETMKEPQEP